MPRSLPLALSLCLALSCAPQTPDGRLGSQPRVSSAATVALPIPAYNGAGLAMKAICCNTSNFGGGDPLSQAAALLNGATALQVPAAPPTSFSLGSFTLNSAIDLSSGGTAGGQFNTNVDPALIFGAEKSNWAASFAGYVRIDPSTDGSAIQKTFVVASDDGARLAVNNGSGVTTAYCDASRSMDSSFFGKDYYGGCSNPFGQTVLTVTFPAAGGLFPIDLLYFNITGDAGLELSWAPGKITSGTSGTLPTVLVPAADLYAPAVKATLTASDSSASVQPGDTITYAVNITNTGNAPLSSYTFAVRVDSTKLVNLAGGMGGSCSNSNGLLVCPLSTVLNPGDSTSGTFTAQVKSGLAAGTIIDVQGVVTGLATTSDVATSAGGSAEATAGEIYALTDDPNVVAGSNFQTVDTGNTPAGLASSAAVGEADDDATRIVVGAAPEKPPAITGPATPGTSDVELSISGTSNAPAGVTVNVTVSQLASSAGGPSYNCSATTTANGAWACAPQAFPDGSYSAKAVLVDAGGNAGPSSAVYNFSVISPPAPAIVAPSSGQTINSSNVAINGTDSARDGDTVRVSVTGAGGASASCTAILSGGHFGCSVSLADGSWSATASVVEATGTPGTSSGAVPFSVVTGGACGSTLAQTPSPTNQKKPAFNGTAGVGFAVLVCEGGSSPCGSGSTLLCSVPTVGASGTWSCTAQNNLADGTHTAVAVASGSVVCPSNNDVFTVDTTPPPAPGFDAPASPTSQSQPVFTGTAVPSDRVQVSDGHGNLLCTATVGSDGKWSCTSSPIADGSYNLQAVDYDAAGNASPPATQPLVVNTSKPGAPTLSGPASPTSNPALVFTGVSDVSTTVVVRDSSGHAVCATLLIVSAMGSSGPWSCTTAALADGSYTFTAVATSSTNVASDPSAPLTIVVDTTPPAAPVLDPVPTPTAQHFPRFSGNAEAGAQVAVFEGTTQLCAGPSAGTFSCVSTVSLPNGSHSVIARATDGAGNVSPDSAADAFVVDDTSAPPPTLDPLPASPNAQPGYTAQTQPTFSGTGVPGDLVTARVVSGASLCSATVAGDGSWSCASSALLIGQPATTYSVEAVQQAPAGTHAFSTPSAAIEFTVDTHVPRTPELDPPATPDSNHTPAFTGSAENGDAIEVDDVAQGPICTGTADNLGNFSCTPGVALSDGNYALTARSFSQAGVPSASSTPARPLQLYSPSGIPAPTLDALTSPTNVARPTFTGTAAGGTNVAVRSSGQTLCSGPIANGKWSCQPSTALADGTYVLTARAVDTSGDISPESAQVVLVVDTTAPAAPLITSPANGAELEVETLTATGSAQVGSTVSLTLDGSAAGSTTAAPDGSWSVSLGAVAGGMHQLRATASDAAGNTSAPAQVTFSIALAGTVRGGCASGGVPLPALLVLAAFFFWPRRRAALATGAKRASLLTGIYLASQLFFAFAAAIFLGAKLLGAREGSRKSKVPIREGSALQSPKSKASPSWRFALGLFTLALLASTGALAQDVSLSRFVPANDGSGFLGVEGARAPIDGDPRMTLRLFLDSAVDPLVFQASNGTSQAVISNRFESFLGAQFHLYKPLSLAVQVPFLLAESGNLSALPPSGRPGDSLGGALGDIRITPRVSILREETAPFDLAGEATLTLPTAAGGAYAGDSQVQFEALASAGRHLALGAADFELLGNLLLRLRAAQQILDVKTGDELGLRLGFAWLPEKMSAAIPRRVFLEAEAESTLRGSFDAGTVPAEWRAGGSWCAGSAVSLDLGAGTALGNGIGAPKARVIFGLGYAPDVCGPARERNLTPRNAEMGPIAANKPAAPTPAPAQSAEPVESHAATVVHVEEKPIAPAAPKPTLIAPAPAPAPMIAPPPSESAALALPELELPPPPLPAMPLEPLPAVPPAKTSKEIASAAFPEKSAAPAPGAARSDPLPAPGSSAPGNDDALPLTALVAANDAHPSQHAIVAPVAPAGTPGDRDGDGVRDEEDSCPDQAGPSKNHGCPEGSAMHVAVAPGSLTLDGKIEFRAGTAALDPHSLTLLLQLAHVLRDHPELGTLEIRSHIGGTLSPDKAMDLSIERAATVSKFLIGQGVDPDRLVSEGVGSSEPIAPNLTPLGRKLNDRVELKIEK